MWSQMPLLRLLIPFLLAILGSEYLWYGIPMGLLPLLIVGACIITGGLFYGLIFGYRRRWLFGLFIMLFMLVAGTFLNGKRPFEEARQLALTEPDSAIYLGVIREKFVGRERSCRGLVEVNARLDSTGVHELPLLLMVYTAPDSLLPLADAGSRIMFRASVKAVSGPANPAEFDYRKYLSRHKIYHSTYLKTGEWKVIKGPGHPGIIQFAQNLRNDLLLRLQEEGVRGSEFSVSAALLLGDDAYLDSDTRHRYARAGAMHILCVSGLHVGVIFLVMSTLLSFLRRLPFGKYILPVLLVASIWSYALITGLAPPVVRASTMISFIITGRALGRHSNIYNTLAASALLMLFMQPQVFFEAGFRLSYAAVVGIVMLQKPINNLLYFKYFLPDRIWSITAVSLAAQLGTLPLVLHYFHQFPLYGLITNLIVIPMSSLIIYSGLLFFIIPVPGMLSGGIAKLLAGLVYIMDRGISFAEGMPYAVWPDIRLDLAGMLILYVLIIGFMGFLMLRQKVFLFMGLSMVLVFSAYRLYLSYLQMNQNLFVVYAIRGHTAIDIIKNRDHIFFADSALMTEQQSLMEYSVEPFWLEKGLNKPEKIPLYGERSLRFQGTFNVIPLPGKRAALWRGRLPKCSGNGGRLDLDCLIVCGDAHAELDRLLDWFDPEFIIVDASVPPWRYVPPGAPEQEKWWDVRREGAYVKDSRVD